MGFIRKLRAPHIWERMFYERLTEPLHLNFLALGVAIFGSFRRKVDFDLVLRFHNAYGLLNAATNAKKFGLNEVTAIEFGVAAGAGLMNMASIAKRVEKETGVRVKLAGFDTGKGMPAPLDYRDHPESYGAGDFPMDYARLRASLPEDVELVLGELRDTVPQWVARDANPPIGYIVIDVDYHSSAVDALRILEAEPDRYLPVVTVFLDDVRYDEHNSWCGELLAVSEFNKGTHLRKIERPAFIDQTRVFKNAPWLRQIFFCQILDHPSRQPGNVRKGVAKLENPYL
jgi:hypothetical protein